MTTLVESIEIALSDLRDSGKSHALVGGLAVSARVEPRTTRDVDIAVKVSADPEAEALMREMMSRGYTIESVVEQEATARIATRPQDAGDIAALLRAAEPGDFTRARQSIELISERGYSRGRDLADLFARARLEFGVGS